MNITKFNELLKNANRYKKPTLEKTFLSIGGKGFYENPITDLLSFFLDPHEVHGFGGFVLDQLIESVGLQNELLSKDLITSPSREVVTEDGFRIDLIIESSDWVIVIENKINHLMNNPFEHYELYAKRKYYNKRLYFLIISPSGASVRNNWLGLSYETLVSQIKRSSSDVFLNAGYSKWLVLFREFVLNLEQFTVSRTMNDQEIEFIERNYQQIVDLNKLRDSYLEHIKNWGIEKLNEWIGEEGFSGAIHNWPQGPAIRLYCERWVGKSNIVIQLNEELEERRFCLYMYQYDIPEEKQAEAHAYFNSNNQLKYKVESKTICCYQSLEWYKSYRDLEPEFKKFALLIHDFNSMQSKL